MKTIKVFYSQPMHGLTKEEIQEERIKMQQEFRTFLDELGFEDYILQDVNDRWDKVDLLPYIPGRLYWLGRSISQMDQAEFVCFHRDWRKAPGCCAEHATAHSYFSHRSYVDDVNSEKTIEYIFWGNNSGSKDLTT